MTKSIVLEFVFDEVQEDDYQYFDFKEIKTVVNELTANERNDILETWMQSDWYHVDFCNDYLPSAIDKDGASAGD